MNEDVKTNRNYQSDFDKAVIYGQKILPIIQTALKAKKLVHFELLKDNMLCEMFDVYSGIDAVSIDENGMRGLALRIQFILPPYTKPYNTFTIRYKRATGTKTEYQKRTEAIRNNKGYLYPYLTGQFYVNKEGKIITGAICETKKLYEFIECNLSQILSGQSHINNDDGNKFIYVYFNQLENNGIELLKFENSQISITKKILNILGTSLIPLNEI